MKLTIGPRIEPLESRRLLADVAISINFQPAGALVPTDYIAETGAAFGPRGAGLQFGFNQPIASAARDRNSPLSPDQRYDTLIHTQLYGQRTWEIALAPGKYKVHLVAGDPAFINSVYKFNLEGALALSGTPNMQNHWIESTTIVNVTDGRLTVANAAGAVNNKLAFIEIVSATPASGTWTTLAPNPVKRFEAASAAVNGKLYVFGGYDAAINAMTDSEVYDPGSDTWTRIADMPEPLTHCGVAVVGTTAYFAGGFIGANNTTATSHVWKYDTLADTWTSALDLPAPRAAGALVLVNRTLHFFGGASAHQTTDYGDHWKLNLDSPAAWLTAPAMPNPRNHFGYAALNGKIYAIGGQHLQKEITDNIAEVDIFDTTTYKWARAADLPLARSHTHTSTFVFDNKIGIAGGQANGAKSAVTLNEVLTYDPTTNLWTAIPPLPAPRQAAVAQAIGSMLYVTTGAASGTVPQATTWKRPLT